jgi:hypothetical protein
MKYNQFDRECPFKEEWLKESDKAKYKIIRKRILNLIKCKTCYYYLSEKCVYDCEYLKNEDKKMSMWKTDTRK